jgi:hypothetical protein
MSKKLYYETRYIYFAPPGAEGKFEKELPKKPEEKPELRPEMDLQQLLTQRKQELQNTRKILMQEGVLTSDTARKAAEQGYEELNTRVAELEEEIENLEQELRMAREMAREGNQD